MWAVFLITVELLAKFSIRTNFVAEPALKKAGFGPLGRKIGFAQPTPKDRENAVTRDAIAVLVEHSRFAFSWLKEELGELTEKQQQLVTILELVRIEEFLVSAYGFPGRPPEDRTAIARAFVAKVFYNMPTTRVLLDRLNSDRTLRRLCGWERKDDVPKEWTFSRSFS